MTIQESRKQIQKRCVSLSVTLSVLRGPTCPSGPTCMGGPTCVSGPICESGRVILPLRLVVPV